MDMTYHRHLQNLRVAAGLDIDELASRAGMDASKLNAVEAGERGLAMLELEQLADALGVHTDEVLFGPKPPMRMNCDPAAGAAALKVMRPVIDDYFAVEALANARQR